MRYGAAARQQHSLSHELQERTAGGAPLQQDLGGQVAELSGRVQELADRARMAAQSARHHVNTVVDTLHERQRSGHGS